MTLAKAVSMKYNKTIEKCSNEEIYYALLDMTKQMAEDKVSNEGKKKQYYISAEFLIGKLLSNNLINLGIYDSVKSELEASGKNIGEIEEIELEPSLGNGGLGRLAACFVDSIATLGLNGDGVGLNYHYGLFKQVFDHNLQKETPNPWITPDSWLTKTDVTYPVQFGGFTVQSRLYNIDDVGYNNRTTKLRLFDIETVDESIVGDTIDFNKDDIAKNLTLFLYPDDSDDKGRLLRVYQQYFMVSNAARLILDEAVEKGSNLHDLADYATVQINDTHPSMVIPELIRLLQERGILMMRQFPSYLRYVHTPTIRFLQRHLRNGQSVSWIRQFHSLCQLSASWTTVYVQKFPMKAPILSKTVWYTWHMWISTTDTVLTVLHICTQRS